MAVSVPLDFCMSINGVGAQGNPCTVTIFWSIVQTHLLYSASTPRLVIKHSILYNGISSQLLGSIKNYLSDEILIHLKPHTQDMWGCFCFHMSPPTYRAVNYTQFEEMVLYVTVSC
jgi:hypothetical protein